MATRLKARKFNKEGIDIVKQILSEIRENKKIPSDRLSSIIIDDNYTKEIEESIEVDLDFNFSTKIELIDYFASILSDTFLSKHRKDTGFWTWLAITYYKQFLKHKGSEVQISAEYCWIYDSKEYRYSRRHFIAGAIYLNNDFESLGEEGKELFFTSKPNEFGGFIDAVTYKEEFARTPAMLQVAVWLYYDKESPKKMKSGVTSQNKPGTIRELTRMADQFAMTYDFYSLEDASKLWKLLPPQFDKFKGSAQH